MTVLTFTPACKARRFLLRLAIGFALFASVCPAAYGRGFSIGVNLLELANYGTLNVEAGQALSRHISLQGGFLYNGWSFEEPENALQNCRKSAWAGLRVWTWTVNSGWWIQGKFRWNESAATVLTGIDDWDGTRKLKEGTQLGAGIAGGYALMLSRNLNLDFSLGVWGGAWKQRRMYSSSSRQRLLPEETVSGLPFFTIEDVSITLTYVF